MKDAAPQTIHLADYTPPAFLIDDVHLTFRLAPQATRVLSRIRFRPNPEAAAPRRFALDGEHMRLIGASIDGAPVTPDVTDHGLTCEVPDAPFEWRAEVEIGPADNTALEGLYVSNGMYCTQCEAEGFRRITYYPDRPDVMAPFTVRIESDLPVRLSNGNPVGEGDGWSEWHDPWPKPAYLFALVAGDLSALSSSFTTMEGREVALNIWVRPGPDEAKLDWGMDALIRSMRWDEEVYGRAYDLDVFNIVAVDDFNMGAMENKGLNIFNSAYVLTSPETATDNEYDWCEAVIAHEYFHNWTGNRITCRDWFQLCLKEGLTVFRDQQFTSDVRSAAVKRIDDAITMKTRQFAEDAGPLAHPVRPASFVEINNFYTATVYEKGAEVIGMLKRLVGDDAYYAGCNLYFDRHDGQAVRIEDWLACFEEVSGRDLGQFARWYSQAGTPRVTASGAFADGTFTLTLRQQTPPTPGQPDKAPLLIPVAVGLLGADGDEVTPTRVLELSEAEQSFAFEGLDDAPVPSILRDFSAPVILDFDGEAPDAAFLLAHDTDPFNRWEAGRELTRGALKALILNDAQPGKAYLDGLGAVAGDSTLDPDFRGLVLSMPSQDDIARMLADANHVPDPGAIHAAFERLRDTIAGHLEPLWPQLRTEMEVDGPYSPTGEDVGKRCLGNVALGYLTRLDGGEAARAQFDAADNMTQRLSALGWLVFTGRGADELARYERDWRDDRLAMNKWFSLQTSLSPPDNAVATTRQLTDHADFDWKNPNRFRSVLGGFAGNHAGFHDASGAGYALLADWLIRLDPLNPQTTARMMTAFQSWRRYDDARQALMRAELERIAGTEGLSGDTSEMVARLLG